MRLLKLSCCVLLTVSAPFGASFISAQAEQLINNELQAMQCDSIAKAYGSREFC